MPGRVGTLAVCTGTFPLSTQPSVRFLRRRQLLSRSRSNKRKGQDGTDDLRFPSYPTQDVRRSGAASS